MLIDCDSCEVRGLACGDCVVTVLLGSPPEGVVLDRDERRALEVLAGSGLVPPLRLVGPEAAETVREPVLTESDESAAGSQGRRHAGRPRFAS